MITLYDCATAPSPRRARILLAEKGVAHETVEVDLRNGEQLSDAYRAGEPAMHGAGAAHRRRPAADRQRGDHGLARGALSRAAAARRHARGEGRDRELELARRVRGPAGDRRGDAQQRAGDGQAGARRAGELCADSRAGAARPGAGAAVLRDAERAPGRPRLPRRRPIQHRRHHRRRGGRFRARGQAPARRAGTRAAALARRRWRCGRRWRSRQLPGDGAADRACCQPASAPEQVVGGQKLPAKKGF